MSAAGYSMTSGAVAFTGAQTKTLCNAINAANSLVRMTSMNISTDGVTSSAVPGPCGLFKSSQAGAGTAGASTVIQNRGGVRTVQATVGTAYSAEPTVLTIFSSFYVPQYNGLVVLQFPLGREPEQVTSANGLGFRWTSTANVNAVGSMEFEEG